ncbi:hypothetical protein EOS_39875 [Caballeronia mineralivorans PML1(12)]|uniref:Uncharacterized protein n=1 Tax=Caballeronia mineralivorans PML1(12) TaxID=908627 RepID=A0A0J1CJD1_9BURK|nr:hypothetical protein EOS_39875 [Caballeronia mineralivorans PML1(12)]
MGEISEAMLDFLFKEFGWLFDQAQEANVDPAQAAYAMSENSDFVKDLAENLPGFVDALREYLGDVFDAGSYHLQDGTQLKAAFSGGSFGACGRKCASMRLQSNHFIDSRGASTLMRDRAHGT